MLIHTTTFMRYVSGNMLQFDRLFNYMNCSDKNSTSINATTTTSMNSALSDKIEIVRETLSHSIGSYCGRGRYFWWCLCGRHRVIGNSNFKTDLCANKLINKQLSFHVHGKVTIKISGWQPRIRSALFPLFRPTFV